VQPDCKCFCFELAALLHADITKAREADGGGRVFRAKTFSRIVSALSKNGSALV